MLHTPLSLLYDRNGGETRTSVNTMILFSLFSWHFQRLTYIYWPAVADEAPVMTMTCCPTNGTGRDMEWDGMGGVRWGATGGYSVRVLMI